MSQEHSFFLTVFAAIFTSLIWAREILKKSRSVEYCGRLVVLVAAFAALCVTPISDFGQRDHLTVIFVLPYVILVAFETDISRRERIAVGLAASIGIALKPHFVLLPIALAVVSAYQRRKILEIFAAQHVSVAIGGAIYFEFVAIVHPEYFELIVPMARLVYGNYSVPFLAVALVSGFAVLPMLLIVAMNGKFEGAERNVTLVLSVTVCAFIASYFLQNKGWRYHTIPIYSYLLVAASWVLYSAAVQMRSNRRLKVLLAFALPVTVAVFAIQIAKGTYFNPNVAIYAPYLTRDGESRSFVALDTRVSVSFPVANLTRSSLATHFSALWTIPGAVRQLTLGAPNADQRGRLEQTLEFTRRTVVGDIVACEPDVVLIDVAEAKAYFGEVAFDYLAFLEQDEQFSLAWRDYHLAARANGIEIWEKSRQNSPSNFTDRGADFPSVGMTPPHLTSRARLCMNSRSGSRSSDD
jgi:hypothetical protein